MTTLVEATLPPQQRVCVWFGEQTIADYTADPETAVRYQAAMTRRFPSLRVTMEPAVADAELA